MTVFEPSGLSDNLTKRLDGFLSKNCFRSLYKSYDWGNDNYKACFPDICRLELQLSTQAKSADITLADIIEVAHWGKLANTKQIAIKNKHDFGVLNENMRSNSNTLLSIEKKPENLALLLQNSTKGLGPTYVSKVLRFALPKQYGAIDTRCARVFGKKDHNWLQLVTRESAPNRWYIPSTQQYWPSEYGAWINILRYFAHEISEDCPHPQNFMDSGLRTKGVWTCADVEMALFAYASAILKQENA